MEPPAFSYVNCGPAAFGRPSALPHPACSDAYFPLPVVCWSLIGLGLVCGIAAVALLTVTAITRGHPDRFRSTRMCGDNGSVPDTSRRQPPPYWKNALLSVGAVIVMFGGSGIILRATDNLSLTYGFIVLAAVFFAVIGVVLKRRTDRGLSGSVRR